MELRLMKCPTCRGSGQVSPKPTLRPREMEALKLLAQGLDHPAVAKRMFIGLNTAYQYSKRIRAYFGVESTQEAVAKAVLWDVI